MNGCRKAEGITNHNSSCGLKSFFIWREKTDLTLPSDDQVFTGHTYYFEIVGSIINWPDPITKASESFFTQTKSLFNDSCQP